MIRHGSQGWLRGKISAHFRDCLFTPLVTLWTFLAHVLSADGSCRAAVAKLLAFLAARTKGASPHEDCFYPDTGPYCKARKRLPERLVERLAKESGRELQRQDPGGQLLGGRRVKVVDGTTVSMPDTPLVALAALTLSGHVASAERHIYVADHSIKKILKITDDGKVLWEADNNNGHEVQPLKNGHVLVNCPHFAV